MSEIDFDIEDYIINTLHMSLDYLSIDNPQETALYDFVRITFDKLLLLRKNQTTKSDYIQGLSKKEFKYYIDSGLLTTGEWLLQNQDQKSKELIEDWNDHLYIDRELMDIRDLQLRVEDVKGTLYILNKKIKDFIKFNKMVKDILETEIDKISLTRYFDNLPRYNRMSIMQVQYRMKKILDSKKLKRQDYDNMIDLFNLTNEEPTYYLYKIFFYFYNQLQYKEKMQDFLDWLLSSQWYGLHINPFIFYLYENGYNFTEEQLKDMRKFYPAVLMQIEQLRDSRIRIETANQTTNYLDENHLNDLVREFI